MTKQSKFTEDQIAAIRKQAYEIQKQRQVRVPISQEDWDKAIEEIGKTKNIHEYNWRKFWDWTGIKDKKLWDFIQLSMVPMILFIGNWTLQESTKRREIEVAEDKARQEALVKYTEGISDLIQKGLLNSKSDRDPNFLIAKAKTTLALISLNSQRQTLILQFLASTGLNDINNHGGILFQSNWSKLKLDKSDFTRAKMLQANFLDSSLIGTDFTGGDLRSIDFGRATLRDTRLHYADLMRAQLQQTNLRQADFLNADLTLANLTNADMKDANLKGAILNQADLSHVKNLTVEQVKQAYLCKTKLPKEIIEENKTKGTELDKTVDTNKNCQNLHTVLQDKYSQRYDKIYEVYKKQQENKKEAVKEKKDIVTPIIRDIVANPWCIPLIPGDEYHKNVGKCPSHLRGSLEKYGYYSYFDKPIDVEKKPNKLIEMQ
jgi:uncharacterized protein YjbI with pentapeptide repeats